MFHLNASILLFICLYTYKHTYMFICVCVCVCVYLAAPWHTEVPGARDQTCATAVTMLDPSPVKPPGNSSFVSIFRVKLTHY